MYEILSSFLNAILYSECVRKLSNTVRLVDAAAITAVASAKGSSVLLLPHIRASVKVTEQDGDYVVRVVDGSGNPRVNGKGEFLSIADLVSEMRQSDEFGRAFDATGTTGGGAGSTKATGGDKKTTTRAQFDSMDNAARMAFAKAGGKVID